jgi:uncharacterized membrane protein YgdD (TMEM256/DUF423 family)
MIPAQKWLLIMGALMGFMAVAAGAFGAHALKQKLEPEMLSVFEVGARYQIYHALAICLTALAISIIPGQFMPIAGWLFFAGSIIFSGSLYLLALTGIKILGAITPIGGVLLLAGWLSFAIGAFKAH